MIYIYIYIYLCTIYIYTHTCIISIYIYLHIYLGGCLEQPISWGTPACRIHSSPFWTTGMVGVHPANRWQFYAGKEYTVVTSGNTLFPVQLLRLRCVSLDSVAGANA